MKKNAFTLIEILAVIVLLGVLAIMVTTASTRLLNNSKQSLYDTQLNTILEAARKWSIANNDKMPMDSAAGSYKLCITDLATDGYLDSDELIDPRDNSQIQGYININYNDSKKQYNYQFVEGNCA